MLRISAALAAFLSLACLAVLYAQPPDLPPGPVQAKVTAACIGCHDSGIIEQQRLSKAAWTKEVDKMIKWGAVVDPADRDAFIEYLSANFPADRESYRAPKSTRAQKKPRR